MELWLEKLQEFSKNRDREIDLQYITQNGYNIKKEAKKLEEKYLELYKKI